MKKIFFLSVIPILIFTKLSAQSFEKGSKVIDASFEFGIYSTSQHDKIANTDKSDHAASKIFNGSFEYGILNWLGVGGKFQYDSYISNDSTRPKPSVGALDIAATVNAHLAKKDHFDLTIGANIGVSFFHYDVNDAYNSMATGTGSWIDIHITPRFYFGKHFGMHLNLAYSNFNYPNLIEKSSGTSPINFSSLKGSGANIGIGFQYRF